MGRTGEEMEDTIFNSEPKIHAPYLARPFPRAYNVFLYLTFPKMRRHLVQLTLDQPVESECGWSLLLLSARRPSLT